MENDNESSWFLIEDDEYVEFFNDLLVDGPNLHIIKITVEESVAAGLYGLLAVCGVCINLWVLKTTFLALCRKKLIVCSVVIYITALTILNLFILLSVPFNVVNLILGYWPFSKPICQLHWVFESLNKMMTSLVVSFITVACYCAVCRPRMKKMYKSKFYSGLNLSVGLGIVLMLCRKVLLKVGIYHLITTNVDNKSVVTLGRKCLYLPDHTEDLYYFMVCSFICGYVIPTVAMIFSYGSILHTVLFKMPISQSRMIRFRRVAKPVFIILFFYLLSWTPYWTLTLILFHNGNNNNNGDNLFGTASEKSSNLHIIFFVHLLPYANSAASTLLYTLLNSELWKADCC